jgi:hypothetical protein
MSTEQNPNWHVTACVHHPITPAQADGLFDVVADAAHDWEPAGVDVDVSGGPCYCRQSPSGPSFGAALGTILGASGGASQAGEDQAGVDRAVRDALRHIGYDGPPADPRSPDETEETHGFDAGDPDLDVSLPRLSRPIRRLLLVSPAVARVVDAAREVARVLRPAVSRPSRALVAAVDALDADADPATERDFDAAAAAAVPVTVVGTRPPWQVHEGPPPTHGTPAAPDLQSEPANVSGWDGDTVEQMAAFTNSLLAAVDRRRDERDAARAELATARRDAAADALLMVRRRFAESTDGDGNIDTGWWLMWLQAWAAEVRTGQRTISPQPATTPDDLPEWERDIVFPATDTTEEP